MSNGETSSKGHTYMQWSFAILANMSILIFGMQWGWLSPATKFLKSTSSPTGIPLTDSEITWLASLPSLIAIPGVIMSSFVSDVYGRKIDILLILGFEATSWLITLCPSTIVTLLIARFIFGLATGACFHVVSMYAKEISQPSIAGSLGSLVILSQNLGVFLMYCIGGYLDYYTVLWVATPLPIITFIFFLKAPESPYFLVKIGKVQEAKIALALLRGLEVEDKELINEIDCIKKEDDFFKTLPNFSFITIFKNKPWRRGFLLMLLVVWAHGYNGTFAIVSHANALLSNSGLSVSPELQSLFVPIFMTIGSSLAVLIVDKMDRKVLLSSAFIAIALALISLATTQLMQSLGSWTPGWLPIVGMSTALFGRAVGGAPVPYVLMLEMFSFQIRAKLMGILILNIWFMTFVQTLSLDVITTYFGAYTAFYCFAAVNVIGAIVVVFFIPETKGKSVEQIENALGGEKVVNDT